MGTTVKLAILFADIAGSTRIYERVGDVKASAMMGRALEVLGEVVRGHGGKVVKTIGDEIMCVFAKPHQAVEAACAMQEKMDERPVDGEPLAIRVGLHYGPVVVEGRDVFGDAVNVAARMVALAKAGQVITTSGISDPLEGELKAKLRHLYNMEVKGKRQSIDLYEVIWQDQFDLTCIISIPSSGGVEAAPATLRLEYADQVVEVGSERHQVAIGRGPQNDLVVEDASASRQHARVEFRSGKFILADHSTNGTFVITDDGRHITLRREELTLIGDGRIGFGQDAGATGGHLIRFHHG